MALNIFEPRYRLMVRRCMEGNRCFGMASVSQGHALSEVACLAEIMTCQPLPDGCVCAMPARASSLALISVLCVPRDAGIGRPSAHEECCSLPTCQLSGT